MPEQPKRIVGMTQNTIITIVLGLITALGSYLNLKQGSENKTQLENIKLVQDKALLQLEMDVQSHYETIEAHAADMTQMRDSQKRTYDRINAIAATQEEYHYETAQAIQQAKDAILTATKENKP